MTSDNSSDAPLPWPDAPDWYAYLLLVVLTFLSGCFSGLNLGLMSLTVEDLNIVVNSSTDPTQVGYAKRILPLRKKGNLLLCTLLIGNTLVNVMLSVLTDPIWQYFFGPYTIGAILALALPSAIIVVLGEIVPQSVCSRYALEIGAKTLPLTYVFVVVTYPAAKPISLLLDRILGDEISGVFTRQGLLELIKLNVESAVHAKESGLTKEDGRLLGGALTFKDRTVGEVMTPLANVYALPLQTTVLDRDTFFEILERGHTRIPVYDGPRSNIVALLLAKNLLGIGYEKALPLTEVLALFESGGGGGGGGGGEALADAARRPSIAEAANPALASRLASRIVRVHKDTRLNVALDACKRKRVHMLVVTPEPAIAGMPSAAGTSAGNSGRASLYEMSGGTPSRAEAYAGAGAALGIATVEDFLEEILQEEIVDETDVYVDNTSMGEQAACPSGSVLSLAPAASEGTSGSAPPSPLPLVRLNSKHVDTTAVLRHMSKGTKEPVREPPRVALTSDQAEVEAI